MVMDFIKTSYGQTIILIVCLMLEGLLIKYAPFFTKVSNNFIPFILMATSVIICGIYFKEINPTIFVNGILTAVLATGAHQSGKIVWKDFIKETMLTFRKNMGIPDVGDLDAVKDKEGVSQEAIDAMKPVVDEVKTVETIIDTKGGTTEEKSE